jgi:CspA family cold shock protein
MGRYKAYRERPSRRHDDEQTSNDQIEHRWPLQATHSPDRASDVVDVVVKWFNADKGFGFVAVTNGPDAFLHIRQLEAAGHSSVPEGARLKVRLGEGQKGTEVTAVLDVDVAAAQSWNLSDRPSILTSTRQAGGDSPDIKECLGTVRMYKTDKGFGFIGLDNGGKDAFVHASTVEKSGLSALKEGERVRVKLAHGQKGLEVRSINILDRS